MSEYTPTTEQMREDHERFTTYTVHHFDRWLATVKAEAWDEGYKARKLEERAEYEQIFFGSEKEPFPEVLRVPNPYREESGL